MWWVASVLLLALWVLGLASGAPLGAWVHGAFLLALLSASLGAARAAMQAKAGAPHP